ncbi:MAG: response regulator [Bacteroidota bacterium]
MIVSKAYGSEDLNANGVSPLLKLNQYNGLSSPRVYDIKQDRKGFVWISTNFGINRFNGNSIKTYHAGEDDNTLWINTVSELFISSDDRLFALTRQGLNEYDPATDAFKRHFILPDQKKQLPVYSIAEHPDGSLWIATSDGIYILKDNTFQKLHIQNINFKDNYLHLFFDKNKKLWIGNYHLGLFQYDEHTQRVTPFETPCGKNDSLRSPEKIVDIKEDQKGRLWIATWGEGLWKISSDRDQMQCFTHNPAQSNTPSSDYLKKIELDRTGNLWIGYEEAGLDHFDLEKEEFIRFFSFQTGSSVYEKPSVYEVFIDDEFLMWVGFRTEGVQVFPLAKSPFRLYHDPRDDAYQVFSLLETASGMLAGSIQSVYIFDQQSGEFTRHFLPRKETPTAMGKGNENEVFIATYNNNIYSFDLQSHEFTLVYQNQPDQQPHLEKIRLLFMHENHLLVGSQSGLYSLNTANGEHKPKLILEEWIHTIRKEEEPEELWVSSYSNNIYKIASDQVEIHPYKAHGNAKGIVKQQNEIFIGTETGFYVYNLTTGETHKMTEIFPSENLQVNALEKDINKGIWFSSYNSIVYYDRLTGRTRSYDHRDQLPAIRFNDGASAVLKDGKVAFGGRGGFVIFNPPDFKAQKNSAAIEFTNLKIFNEDVIAHQQGSPLTKNISETSAITFKNHHNTITFEFSLLSFANRARHSYQYQISEIHNDWIDLNNQNYVTLTNLNPGNYTLKIRASNQDHVWSKKNSIDITILPPAYLSWYALLIYFLIATAISVMTIRFIKARNREKNEFKTREIKFKNLKRLVKQENKFHEMKVNFFTNISHELRTPLSLILAPLETWISSGKAPDKENMNIMYKNAERLNRLVTQLLDFRKIESGKLDLELSMGNIAAFCQRKALLFNSLAKRKGVKYFIKNEGDTSIAKNVWFDSDKLEKIIYNLLSNAFKYTASGSVNFSFKTETIDIENHQNQQKNHKHWGVITVADTGKGITKEDASHIFENFFSKANSKKYHELPFSEPGTGIGLSLTKELTQIHQGHISYKPRLPKGSEFCVKIPLDLVPSDTTIKTQNKEVTPVKHLEPPKIKTEDTTGKKKDADQKTYRILLVEDNKDLRRYITKELEADFDVLLAENGKYGLNLARKEIPDIIISDIAMPQMDGITMCEELRRDSTTRHIPLIILSSHQSPATKIKSFKAGVDDYITKPFSAEILRIKVTNLIDRQKVLHKKILRELQTGSVEVAVESADEAFLRKALEVVQKNISNDNFSADDFADKMAMSRVHLYRKLKSLTGQAVSDFVKTIRLKVAADLLKNQRISVKETSYQVGFNDPKYFSRCFRQQYGMKPREYANS